MSLNSEVVLSNSEYSRYNHRNGAIKRRVYIALLMALSLIFGFGISNVINGRVIARQDYQLKTSGILNLSESELIKVASAHSHPIYWSGPIRGYSYSLILDTAGSAIVKYIPDSGTATFLSGSQREIATYRADHAWDKSLIAASKEGMSNFLNADGSLVFYGISKSNDVFMAFRHENLQVEIFDSRAGQALSLAMLVGQIRPVVDHEDN